MTVCGPQLPSENTFLRDGAGSGNSTLRRLRSVVVSLFWDGGIRRRVLQILSRVDATVEAVSSPALPLRRRDGASRKI